MTDIAPTFIRSLMTDVLVALEHLSAADDQSRRRSVIRADFAAIEGIVWLLRVRILEAGRSLDCLSQLDMLALGDSGYSVGEQGVLRQTPQYMPLRNAIKYSFRKAREIASDLTIDYEEAGWSALLAAIEVRHRVTHPKASDDLMITSDEIRTSSIALGWLLAAVERALDATNKALRDDNQAMHALLGDLKRDDPETMRLYHAVFMRDDEV